ncbi:MAG: 23S rRNA (uracil(1939)-C(5))-methyltransferase RlmD [Bacillota bacterium]|nr:23S rRNA (uracil(1939)-C(5))-methyltransferase RlmD [Bacillota bacterium]
MLVKNQIIEGKCTDYTYNGLGVVKYDTFCIFVKDMAIDEVGQIKITAVRKDFCYGRLLKIIVSSKHRTEPKCPISRPCGGCQVQHLSYQEQLSFKRNHVQNTMDRIGKLDKKINEVIGSENPYYYRNKVILPVSVDKDNNMIVGFYRYNSNIIIPLEECYLQSDKANRVVKKLKKLFEKNKLHNQIRYIMLRDMEKTSELMVVIVTYQKEVDLKDVVKEVVKFEPTIKSVMQNINGKRTNVILSDESVLLYGRKYIQDELCGLTFNVSAHSFYQVNNFQTEVLYNTVVSLANLSKEDVVLDMYCGVGTIGLVLSRYCKEVIGVEKVEQAVIDARENAKINNIDNATFICGDVEKVSKKLLKEGKCFDCIIVDPPRKGCSKKTIQTLIDLNSKKIIYVSCDPSTLARDLALLKQQYNIEIIQPVDMFPQTYHVECIALLQREIS